MTIRKICKFSILVFSILSTLSNVHAQDVTQANIAYVYPAGGQRGSTFKAIIGGRNFKNAENILVSGNGVNVKILEITVPAQQNDVPGLERKLEKEFLKENPEEVKEIERLGKEGQGYLRKKIRESEENRKALAEMRASYFLRQLSSDALADTIEVEITIDDDAQLSDRSLTVLAQNGLSNSVKFVVGNIPETAEESLRVVARDRASWEKNGEKWLPLYTNPRSYVVPKQKTIVDVKIPIVINGQITEANTDTYKFSAKKGQKLILSVEAQTLIPYISDAVPGWFQPVIVVRDSQDKEVAYNDDFEFRPDSFIYFEVPEDGEYNVEIFDAIYRSREDFVYRLTIGELPFVKGVFPLGGTQKDLKEIELLGYNLPQKKAKINPNSSGVSSKFTDEALREYPHLKLPLLISEVNSVFSTAETFRRENNFESIDGKVFPPLELSLPAFADGRIIAKNQIDSYKFELVHGQKAVVEVFARRLNSPLDSFVAIYDADGNLLSSNDDFEDLSFGLVTHHADSRLEFTAPATGIYYVKISDTENAFGDDRAYRLYIGQPAGDFELRTAPGNINMRPDTTASFIVHAFRKNGFNGQIQLFFKDLPKDWIVDGNVVEAGTNKASVTISAPKNAERKIYRPQFWGRANINGRHITHMSVPCEDMMQAFYYRHLVPNANMNLCVNTWSPFGKRFDSLKFEENLQKNIIKIPLGKPLNLKLGKIANHLARGIICNVETANDSLKISSFYVSNNTMYALIEVADDKVKIGDKGSMVISLLNKRGREQILVDRIPSLKYEIVPKPIDSPKQSTAKSDDKASVSNASNSSKKPKTEDAGTKKERNQKRKAAKDAKEANSSKDSKKDTPKDTKKPDGD